MAWVNTPGVPFAILASPQKARFITLNLPDLVNGEYFWMDILSVDQSDSQSGNAVVGHIPMIYKRANLTIVIREPGGVLSCCADVLALHDPENIAVEASDKRMALREHHIRTYHPQGIRER